VWQVVDVLMGVDEAVLDLRHFFAPSPILKKKKQALLA
jgi:hypothetical protein